MVISRLDVDRIEEEFLSDKRNPAAAESYLRRSLEAIFDVSRYILAKSYGFKDLEYKKIAMELGERGVVEKGYVHTLMKMAGYREVYIRNSLLYCGIQENGIALYESFKR